MYTKEFLKKYYHSDSEINGILIYNIPNNKFLIYQFYRNPTLITGKYGKVFRNYEMKIVNKLPTLEELSKINNGI